MPRLQNTSPLHGREYRNAFAARPTSCIARNKREIIYILVHNIRDFVQNFQKARGVSDLTKSQSSGGTA